jgi:hypothetical protein
MGTVTATLEQLVLPGCALPAVYGRQLLRVPQVELEDQAAGGEVLEAVQGSLEELWLEL